LGTYSLLMSALVLVPLGAQQASPSKEPAEAAVAPSGPEAAVRKRAMDFYSLQMDGKFRQAEAFICEEGKDRFYNSQKRKWLSVKILDLKLEDQDKKALVTMALETTQNTAAGPFQLTMPAQTYWRVEGDSWCRFYPESNTEGKSTPFGLMKAGDPGMNAKKPLNMTPVDPAAVLQGVKTNRDQLHLSGKGISMDQIEIKNTLPGLVELDLPPVPVPGLKLTLSAKRLKANETAILKAEFKPTDKSESRTVRTKIVVEPIGHEIPITISFDAPPGPPKSQQ